MPQMEDSPTPSVRCFWAARSWLFLENGLSATSAAKNSLTVYQSADLLLHITLDFDYFLVHAFYWQPRSLDYYITRVEYACIDATTHRLRYLPLPILNPPPSFLLLPSKVFTLIPLQSEVQNSTRLFISTYLLIQHLATPLQVCSSSYLSDSDSNQKRIQDCNNFLE